MHSRARDNQDSAPLANQDANLDVGIRQELELVIIDRAQNFADTAHPACDNLLGHLFREARPHAVRLRVLCDFDVLIRLEQAQIRLVHKCAHAYVPQVSHLGERVSDFHIVAGVYGQRI
jgi:hypothetical protein